MLRTIITTCGTSLFKSCCWEYDEIPELAYWDEEKIERDKKRPKIERKCYDILKGNFDNNILKNGMDLAPLLRPGVWEDEDGKYLRDMPAELASLKAIELFLADDTKSKRPLSFGDKVILLHSSNDEGLFCADVIYETLRQKKLFSDVEIKKCSVNGLDHSDAEKFSSALKKIWYKIMPECTKKSNMEYIFNLTGGYKGISILLGVFAYNTPHTKIFYMHEDTNYEKVPFMFFDPLSGRQFDIGYFDLIEKKSYISSLSGPD